MNTPIVVTVNAYMLEKITYEFIENAYRRVGVFP
jgi:hypothetical protein